MADKDFVVKNGLVVNGSILVANTTTNRVGVGTSNPTTTLDVNGSVRIVDKITYGGVTYANTVTGTNKPVLDTSPTIQTVLNVQGANNTDSFRVYATGGTKFLTIKPETATDTAQLFYWNGATSVGLYIPGSVQIDSLKYASVQLANSVVGTGSLVLSNTPTFANSITLSGASVPAISLNSTAAGSWKSAINFQNSGASKWQIGADIGGTGGNDFFFWYGPTATTVGYFTATGFVVGNTTVTGSSVTVNGSGLVQHDGINMYVRPTNGANLYFGSGSSNYAAMDSTGNIWQKDYAQAFVAQNVLYRGTTNTSSGYYATLNHLGARVGYMGWFNGSNYTAAMTDNTTPVIMGANSVVTVFIAANNNVGIGNTAPISKLVVYGTASSITDPGLIEITDTSRNGLSMGYDSGNTTSWIYSRSPGTSGRPLNLNQTIWIGSGFGGSYAGNVGIGTSSPAYKLDVAGAINATGDITSSSDIRLKKDILTIESALEKIMKLNGVTFEKIGDSRRSAGLIAQDVKEVLPEAVSENDQGYMSVAYGNMVGLLVESIKELKLEVDKLKHAN